MATPGQEHVSLSDLILELRSCRVNSQVNGHDSAAGIRTEQLERRAARTKRGANSFDIASAVFSKYHQIEDSIISLPLDSLSWFCTTPVAESSSTNIELLKPSQNCGSGLLSGRGHILRQKGAYPVQRQVHGHKWALSKVGTRGISIVDICWLGGNKVMTRLITCFQLAPG